MTRAAALVAGLAVGCGAGHPPAPVLRADTTAPLPLEVRLGYPAGARLLILHFDDLGVAGPENRSAWAARPRSRDRPRHSRGRVERLLYGAGARPPRRRVGADPPSGRGLRRLLREENVHLVTWRQIDSALTGPPLR